MATKRITAAKAKAIAPPAIAPEPQRTPEALAAMGHGEIAYVKTFYAGEMKHMFPQIAELHNHVQLFALFSHDGTPLMIADSRNAIVNGAWTHELDIAVVH
jgi:hypothetical protein